MPNQCEYASSNRDYEITRVALVPSIYRATVMLEYFAESQQRVRQEINRRDTAKNQHHGRRHQQGLHNVSTLKCYPDVEFLSHECVFQPDGILQRQMLSGRSSSQLQRNNKRSDKQRPRTSHQESPMSIPLKPIYATKKEAISLPSPPTERDTTKTDKQPISPPSKRVTAETYVNPLKP